MSDTKTVYNPNTGEGHLIDVKTGLETIPEKSEEEKFQDFLLDLSEDSAIDFIDKLNNLRIPKEKILKYLPEYYTDEQLAEDTYDLCELYLVVKSHLAIRDEQLEESMKQTDTLIATVKSYQDLYK